MALDDEEYYIEKSGSGYRLLNREQKAEADNAAVVLFVFAGMALVILINFGFSPLSFFLIVAALAACILLQTLILFLFGMTVLGGIGYGIIQLFFG